MATRRVLLRACLLAGSLVLALGCASGSGIAPGGGEDELADRAPAPLLASDHHGTRSTHCDAYHVLPVADHGAACHFAASGLDERYGKPVDDSGGEASPESTLRPETELAEGCYGWPGTEFTPEGAAQRRCGLAAGEAAVDFTLATPDGTAVTLADLLKDRPVALVTGGFT